MIYKEYQAFSPSYDIVPSPESPHPTPPLSLQQVVSLSLSSCVSLVELTVTDGKGGERGWGRAKLSDIEKAG
jgi:hypothetical protein